jgi:hypothetical protein
MSKLGMLSAQKMACALSTRAQRCTSVQHVQPRCRRNAYRELKDTTKLYQTRKRNSPVHVRGERAVEVMRTNGLDDDAEQPEALLLVHEDQQHRRELSKAIIELRSCHSHSECASAEMQRSDRVNCTATGNKPYTYNSAAAGSRHQVADIEHPSCGQLLTMLRPCTYASCWLRCTYALRARVIFCRFAMTSSPATHCSAVWCHEHAFGGYRRGTALARERRTLQRRCGLHCADNAKKWRSAARAATQA